MSRIKLVKFSSYCKLTAHQQGRETGRVYSCHKKKGGEGKALKFPVLDRFHWVHLTMQFGRSGFLDGWGLSISPPATPRVSRTTTIYKDWVASLQYSGTLQSVRIKRIAEGINNIALKGKQGIGGS